MILDILFKVSLNALCCGISVSQPTNFARLFWSVSQSRINFCKSSVYLSDLSVSQLTSFTNLASFHLGLSVSQLPLTRILVPFILICQSVRLIV